MRAAHIFWCACVLKYWELLLHFPILLHVLCSNTYACLAISYIVRLGLEKIIGVVADVFFLSYILCLKALTSIMTICISIAFYDSDFLPSFT